MNCKEGENSVNYDCEMPPLYDIFQICENIKIYIHLKTNAGLARLKSFRSPVFSLGGLSEVFFLSMGKIT